MSRFSQAFSLLFVAALASFFYLFTLHRLTEIRLDLPKMEKKLKLLDEEIEELRFEIERVESPQFLEERMLNPDLRTFAYPKESEILFR